jgi:predicted nuclease with TOPRIM domain
LKRCKEEFSLAKSSSKEDIEKMKQDELALQEKVNGLSEELSGLSSKYNQLLGKVEVFESLKDKK